MKLKSLTSMIYELENEIEDDILNKKNQCFFESVDDKLMISIFEESFTRQDLIVYEKGDDLHY